MCAKKTDIDLEFSRFEEEISKLTAAETSVPSVPSAPVAHSSNAVISAAPVSVISFKSNTNFQLPTVVKAQATASSTAGASASALLFQPTSVQAKASATPVASSAALAFKPSSLKTAAATASDSNGPVKRDAAGNVIGGAAATAGDPSQSDDPNKNKNKKKKKFVRAAGGQVWEDETLNEWDPDDFRLFCGDLGNEVNDELLTRAFSKYPSFVKAKVVRDRRSLKTKGYGFVSFKDSTDFIKAMREMDGKYVGNRPIKLRKSTWRDRNIEIVKKKESEKAKMGMR